MIKFTKTELNDLLIEEVRYRKEAQATIDALRNTIKGYREREKLYVDQISNIKNEIYDAILDLKMDDQWVNDSQSKSEYNGIQQACERMLQALMRAS